MAPRGSRAKRLHFPGAARRLAGQPSVEPRATLTPPVTPQPIPTAPAAAKPPTSVEPPVAAPEQPVVTAEKPATSVARAPGVEEAPERITTYSTPAPAAHTKESTAADQVAPDLAPAPVTKALSAVPAGETNAQAAPAPTAPSVPSARAAIRARRGKLRAKRRAAAALALKAKHQDNTITAQQPDIRPTEAPQPSFPAPPPETAPPPEVEKPTAVAAAQPASIASEPTLAQAGPSASVLVESTPAAQAPSPPARVVASSPPLRVTISRIPKKRKFFAELDDSVSRPTVVPISPVDAAAEAPPMAEVPPIASTDTPPAPAAVRRMATHRISKKRANGETGGLTKSTSSVVSAEATPEAAPTPPAAIPRNVFESNAATPTAPEKPVVSATPVVEAPPLAPPQGTDSSAPQPTAPEATSAAATAPSGRSTMSRISKRRKRFVAELQECKASDTPPSIEEKSTAPVVAIAAEALSSRDSVLTTAIAEPTAPIVEAAAAPPAAPVAVTRAVSTRATARRSSMKRARLPPQATLAEAPLTEKAPHSDATVSARAATTPEPMSTPATEAVQTVEAAASAQAVSEATTATEAAPLAEASIPPAAQCQRGAPKVQTPKKKVKHLTAAAIRRRELAAYNRIPKRFRPPEPSLSVLPTPSSQLESTPSSADARPATAVVEAEEVAETPQQAAVNASPMESKGAGPQMCTEEKIQAAVETLAEEPVVEAAQASSDETTAWAAAAVKSGAPLAGTEDSTGRFTAPAEQQLGMSPASTATTSEKGRMTKWLKKRFFTALEETPAATSTEATIGDPARVELSHATEAMEAKSAVPQSCSAVKTIEPFPEKAVHDTEADAEPTAVAEEVAALHSTLREDGKALSFRPVEANTSTEASQPLTDYHATTTNSAEVNSFGVVDELREVEAPLPSESAEAHPQSPAVAQRKVVRITNVRAILKEIRKAKRASKRRRSIKHRHGNSLSQHPATAVTATVDEAVFAEAPCLASEANPPSEAPAEGIDAPRHEEVETVKEMTNLSVTELQPVVEAHEVEETSAAELDAETSVEATIVEPTVNEVPLTAPADEEAVQPPEVLPCTEVFISQAHKAVMPSEEDPLSYTVSSPSPARRQAAKKRIKKHAKLAAARLKNRQTYTASAAVPRSTSYAPVEILDTPLVEAVHAAADPPVPPAEEASSETLVRNAALMLPSGNVVIESFTDDEMCLRRTTLDDHWDVGLRFDWQERTLVISSFPTFEETDERARHPFVQRFKSKPRWMLKEVNETSAAHMKGALDSMKQSLTARFVFRHWK
ncbi:hypothetical protein JKF63_03985 [Porcisia hertigi]|uniref:DUF7759 domain-containing protein n=1 Tax=Porcisia hertigi TaxID=2761500 RepID=A0A836L492_9TRYP|nr:hypothetical protein JKF63_03985 [Porcisia hertigi]